MTFASMVVPTTVIMVGGSTYLPLVIVIVIIIITTVSSMAAYSANISTIAPVIVATNPQYESAPQGCKSKRSQPLHLAATQRAPNEHVDQRSSPDGDQDSDYLTGPDGGSSRYTADLKHLCFHPEA